MAKPTEKQGYQEDLAAHRIRITLTSRDCGNLEKGSLLGGFISNCCLCEEWYEKAGLMGEGRSVWWMIEDTWETCYVGCDRDVVLIE